MAIITAGDNFPLITDEEIYSEGVDTQAEIEGSAEISAGQLSFTLVNGVHFDVFGDFQLDEFGRPTLDSTIKSFTIKDDGQFVSSFLDLSLPLVDLSPETGLGARILSGDDTITGSQFGDDISALSGNDAVSGRGGNDVVWGNSGNDLLWGNEGDDIVLGNTGEDVIFGGKGNDILWGGQHDDIILGNLGNDIIFANLGNDVVFGGQGADYIHGGSGNDTLYGNKGNDTLIGGLGNDKFVFGPESGNDRIEGYEGAGNALGDEILISSAIMDSDQEVLDAVSEDGDGNAVIDLGGGNDITLVGVDSDLLSGQDFGFI
ncbi:MAG: calcium-binding protein [Gammaproteobacteria bacterium]|nr:calcium-binding protein [Gammaproteobacteria bacterium]MDJ0872813.1 calcium-binding protein [Gammaproteobacteria bacterium]